METDAVTHPRPLKGGLVQITKVQVPVQPRESFFTIKTYLIYFTNLPTFEGENYVCLLLR